MSLDFEGSYIDRSALVIMHYQVDVFTILFGEQPSPLLDKCNDLIRRWRVTGRPVMFPNFFLGENYEHASKDNRLISSIVPTGYFRNSLSMKGLAIEPNDVLHLSARQRLPWQHAGCRPSLTRHQHSRHGRDQHHRCRSLKYHVGQRCGLRRTPGSRLLR